MYSSGSQHVVSVDSHQSTILISSSLAQQPQPIYTTNSHQTQPSSGQPQQTQQQFLQPHFGGPHDHTSMFQQHYAQPTFAMQGPTQHQTLHLPYEPPAPPVTPQFYIHPSTDVNTTSTAKILPALSTSSTLSAPVPMITASPQPPRSHTHAASLNSCNTVGSSDVSTSSTVVVDRINICINNHYTDGSGGINAPPTISSPQRQHESSSSIPLVQVKYNHPDMDLLEPMRVVDEPDSTTTTSHTPPSTPDINKSPECQSGESTPTMQSPSTKNIPVSAMSLKAVITSVTTLTEAFGVVASPKKSIKSKQKVDHKIDDYEEDAVEETLPPTEITKDTDMDVVVDADADADADISDAETFAAIYDVTPHAGRSPASLQPPVPLLKTPSTPESERSFEIGEDVLVKQKDDRFYLGVVADVNNSVIPVRYLVKFDDQTHDWYTANNIKSVFNCSNKSFNSSAEEKIPDSATTLEQKMCVGCKQTQLNETVEVCQRCARGFHRCCTKETYPGSGKLWCKRCNLPMVVTEGEMDAEFPGWDDAPTKTEPNSCYCGFPVRSTDTVLQCCKCHNWFHAECLHEIQSKILDGDGFFVFCCARCNDGNELLRRLQMTWADLVHLILYNLPATTTYARQKFVHLENDILPFILKKLKEENCLAIPKAWKKMPAAELKAKIKYTLKENSDRFICGRELKTDPYLYALRNNCPPKIPKLHLHSWDKLNDSLLMKKPQLNFLKDAPENEAMLKLFDKRPKVKDVYEFDDDKDDDEENAECTAEDALPKTNKPVKSMDLSNDGNKSTTKDNLIKSPKKVPLVLMEKSKRRQRKSYSSAHLYQDTVEQATKKRCFENSRTCDPSSDENSSGSRSTTLDSIIPPLENFKGHNNPFRIIMPKNENSFNAAAAKTQLDFGHNGPVIKSSIINTNTHDIKSQLAVLQSAGIIPMNTNLSTSGLTKAAGQQRVVRTIKRRLSAKDITIGPNQEVRYRRNRRLYSHAEVISSTIHAIPSQVFPLTAKDITPLPVRITNNRNKPHTSTSASSSSAAFSSQFQSGNSGLDALPLKNNKSQTYKIPTHNRLLRNRPEKKECNDENSSIPIGKRRRISVEHTNSLTNDLLKASYAKTFYESQSMKESVNTCFGSASRFETESFKVIARRVLPDGEKQYLIEWGESDS